MKEWLIDVAMYLGGLMIFIFGLLWLIVLVVVVYDKVVTLMLKWFHIHKAFCEFILKRQRCTCGAVTPLTKQQEERMRR